MEGTVNGIERPGEIVMEDTEPLGLSNQTSKAQHESFTHERCKLGQNILQEHLNLATAPNKMEGTVNGIESPSEIVHEDTESRGLSYQTSKTQQESFMLQRSKLGQNILQEHSNSTTAPSVSNCYVFKSRLQEYVQKVKLPTPTYNTIKEGPSHEPSFRSTVIVDDVRYDSLPGFFSRKAAEQSAAEVALKALADSGAMDECISQPVHDTGLCKNLLQEYAQKMNFAIPSYICHKDEKLGMVGHFSCTVDIGGIKYIGGAARSKKEAELKAARTALLAIQSDPSVSSTKLNASSSMYTVVPGKKKVPDSVIKALETAAALKPKKSRFKKKRRRFIKDRGQKAQNAKDNDNVNIEGQVAQEAIKTDVDVNIEGQVAQESIKTDVIVAETTDSGFPLNIEMHEKISEFNGGEQLVEIKSSPVQYNGGDFLERHLTTLDSHQSAHGGSNLELTSMPTFSRVSEGQVI